MFFKKGLRDSSLIYKLSMKNPKTSEEMLAITNKYALVEEVTLDTRERKKEKDSSHADQPSSSKGHDKKRKVNHSINTVERPRRICHSAPYGGHYGAFCTNAKVWQSGFYWPTMYDDAKSFFRRCIRCQKHGNINARDTMPLTTNL
jgi:predicted HNH restriction endonuclease